MHNPAAEGTTDFFICDFCRAPWSQSRPMVEGHKGSLICGPCLSVAYTETVLGKQGVMGVRGPVHPAEAPGPWCTMCLERREQFYWTSPLHPEARCCTRCIRQSAGTLEKDEDAHWRRPRPSTPEGAVEPVADDEDDDDA